MRGARRASAGRLGSEGARIRPLGGRGTRAGPAHGKRGSCAALPSPAPRTCTFHGEHSRGGLLALGALDALVDIGHQLPQLVFPQLGDFLVPL